MAIGRVSDDKNERKVTMADKEDGTTTGDGEVEDLETLLGQPAGENEVAGEAAGKPRTRKELVERLKQLAGIFHQVHTFMPGQLVQWKKNMKNRRNPAYGDPVVVIQVLDVPSYDRDIKSGAGSPYFREPLTLLAGRLDNEGDLVCYHYDQRRMEPYAK